MPSIGCASTFAGDGERLAGTTPRPNRAVFGPAGELQGERPAGDSGEEVALRVACEVLRLYFLDWSLIYVSLGNQASGNEVAQPLCDIRLIVVVVVHSLSSSRRSIACANKVGVGSLDMFRYLSTSRRPRLSMQ